MELRENIKISVITPCYNKVEYVEQTIKSIINQEYQNLQYIFIDGGSTDGTLEILQKYSDKIDVLVSEPDEGQYHAISKGMEMADGEVVAWLNSDDIYHPWAFSIVNKIFKHDDIDWIVGLPSFANAEGQCVHVSNNPVGYSRKYIENGWYRSHLGGYLQQESMFWRKSLWDEAGGLDCSLRLAADFELWTRFAKTADLYAVSAPLASFRVLPGEQRSSTMRDVYESEVEKVCARLKSPPVIWDWLAKKGVLIRSLLRMFIYKKTKVISFSEGENSWVVLNLYNSISKSSFPYLVLEFFKRR